MLDFNFIKTFEPISIIGHSNGDFDSFCSCYLMSKYLDFKGIKNNIRLVDLHIDENLKQFGLDFSSCEILKSTDNLFVVDSSYEFHNNIVGCIDHHVATPNTAVNYLNKKQTSCSKIIYDLMIEDGYSFSKEDLKLVCFSLFMDSCSFKSTKALPSDKVWAEKIIKENGWDYNFFYAGGLCLNDLSNPKEFCFYGTKKYLSGNDVFYSSYIQVKENTTEEFDETCIDIIRDFMKDNNIEFWVFIINNVVNDNSKYIEINEDSYHIHYLLFREANKKLLSRGNDIIPRICYENNDVPSKIIDDSNYHFIVKQLIEHNLSISTMESCTSGLIASTITNTEGASSILKGAFVTYSNEAKVLQGVSKDIIDHYGVYSYETAIEMAKSCSRAYNSVIGIGITGTTGNVDTSNKDSRQGEIYFVIKIHENYYVNKISINTANLERITIKNMIVNEVMKELETLLHFS